jgi:hypothetical protein
VSATGEGEDGTAGRRKLKEKAHSREGTMGHVGLLGRWGRRWPMDDVGWIGEAWPGELDSRRKFRI